MNPPTPNLYASRCTPTTHKQPPHMPAIPQCRTRSSGPVGTTPIPPCPTSRREDRIPHRVTLPVSSPASDHLPSPLRGTLPVEGPSQGATNLRSWMQRATERALRPSSPFMLIFEELPPTNFAPVMASTPY